MPKADRDIHQQTWLITGASSGIGLEVTQLLLSRGARVAAIVRGPNKLKSLEAIYPDALLTFQLDLDQTSKIADCIKYVVSVIGDVDVVVSAAGYALVGAAEELAEADIVRQLNVNLVAPIFLAKAILPFFRHRGSGRFIQLSSEGGQITYPSASIYHASKWGLEGFFQSLRSEVSKLGILITLVEPGRVGTQFDNNAVVVEPSIEQYRRGTVGHYFRLLAMGRFPMIGDATKVAQAILDVGLTPDPPLRVILGSDSYKNIHRDLNRRLAGLKKYKEICSETDFSNE